MQCLKNPSFSINCKSMYVRLTCIPGETIEGIAQCQWSAFLMHIVSIKGWFCPSFTSFFINYDFFAWANLAISTIRRQKESVVCLSCAYGSWHFCLFVCLFFFVCLFLSSWWCGRWFGPLRSIQFNSVHFNSLKCTLVHFGLLWSRLVNLVHFGLFDSLLKHQKTCHNKFLHNPLKKGGKTINKAKVIEYLKILFN